jgi:hypothetical protein
LTRRSWRNIALAIGSVVAVALVIGYGHIIGGAGSMRAVGFGTLSWNPATLVLPPKGHWEFANEFVRTVSPEQEEGESYLGFGVILVLATCLVARPKQAVLAIRRHGLFAAALLIFTAYAVSNRVYLGRHLLLEVPLHPFAYQLMSFFRASGRFIWVPIYALSLLSIAAFFKWAPRSLVVPVVLLASVVQLYESRMTIRQVRPVLAAPSDDLLDTTEFGAWLAGHRRLFQFPSWSCEPPRTLETTFRALQIELLAARLAVPTNSVYTARQLKDCAAEALWAVQADLQEGVLYILNKSQVDRSGALAALASAPTCVDAGWGLVCSRKRLIKRATR